MVELKEITKENINDVLKLRVSESQDDFVSPVSYCLAEAYVYRDTAFPFAIYADNLLVGFIMLGYYESKNQYTIWKFLIDHQYQNRGHGKRALALAINYLADKFNAILIYLAVDIRNTVAKQLYRSFGFEETGNRNGSQIEMKLKIK